MVRIIKRTICRLLGHVGEWRQHSKPWRMFRECSRCGMINYRLKPEELGPLSSELLDRGYPELSKMFRDER